MWLLDYKYISPVLYLVFVSKILFELVDLELHLNWVLHFIAISQLCFRQVMVIVLFQNLFFIWLKLSIVFTKPKMKIHLFHQLYSFFNLRMLAVLMISWPVYLKLRHFINCFFKICFPTFHFVSHLQFHQ